MQSKTIISIPPVLLYIDAVLLRVGYCFNSDICIPIYKEEEKR
jgi:hypothetical protein